MSVPTAVKKGRASAPPSNTALHGRLSGKEMAAVNAVDALRGFADITGVECTDIDGEVQRVDTATLVRYFPDPIFRRRLVTAISILLKLFPFPRLGTSSASFTFRLPGVAMTLREIIDVLEQAVASIKIDAEISETTLQDLTTMEAVDALALAMELKSTLLRMVLEVQALELRVRTSERDQLRDVVNADNDPEPPAELDLAPIFEAAFAKD